MYKLKNRVLLNADIISPEVPYAVFSGNISTEVVQKMVATLNRGKQMLEIYGAYSPRMTVAEMAEMMGKMDAVYDKWRDDHIEAERGEP